MSNNLLWYSEQSIGESRHMTPEGYLVCENVPIARIGPMMYAKGEIPVTADDAGLIMVERDEDTVFDPAAMASFNGKPIVINHPSQLVNAKSWKNHAVGHAMNVRRGTGDKAGHMIADLLFTDERGIDAVVNRNMRQISNGYVAEYETVRPGLGRQFNIRGNHIALVNNARCGPTCAVGDSGDRVVALTEQGINSMATFSTDQMSRALAAWGKKDQATLDQLMGEMQSGSSGGPPGRPGDTLPNPADQGTGAQHRIIVNVHGTGQPTASGTATPGMGGPAVQPVMPPDGTGNAVTPPSATTSAGDPASASTMQAALNEILALLKGEDDGDDMAGGDGTAAPNEPPAKTTGDAAPKVKATTDSASLSTFFQDVVARAEILAPGQPFGVTFDAAAAATVTNDSLCSLMRKSLTTAYSNDQSRAIMTPLLLGKPATFDAMTCDAVTSLFMGASELQKMANNYKTAPSRVETGNATNKPPSQNELNKKFRSFWTK